MLKQGGRAAMLALVALWLPIGGCGGVKKVTDGADGAVAERAGPALETSGIADYLPRNTAMVVVAANPAKMADDLGWLGLVEAIDELGEAREEIRTETGLDLLSPRGWADIGIDAARPAGFALVNVNRELGVLAASLASGDLFVERFKELAGKQGMKVEERAVGQARLLDVEEVVLVVRDSWLLAAVGDDKDGVKALADSLAGAVPEASLATLPAYRAAATQLAFGASLAVWLDVPTLAKEGGGDQEIVQEFTAAAMGLELSGTAIETRAIMGLASAGKLRQVFGAHGGAPAIVRTAAEAPLFLASMAFNIQGVLDLAAEQDPDDLAEARKTVRGAVGMDLDRDIVPMLTGEIGLRVAVDQDKLNQGDPSRAFGGAFAIGLRDGAGSRARIDELLANPAFSLSKSPDGRYFQTPPLPWFQVFVGVAGDALIATTAADTFDFAAAGEASFADRVGNSGLSRVLTEQGPTALMTLDLDQAIAAASTLLPGLEDEVAAPTDLPQDGAPDYKRLIDDAATLRAQLKEQRAELGDLRARIRDLGGRWGSLASTGRVDDFGIRFDGGMYLAANETLSVVISDTVRWLKRLDELDGEYKANRARHRDLVGQARDMLGNKGDAAEIAN